jgi:hypothetical protein
MLSAQARLSMTADVRQETMKKKLILSGIVGVLSMSMAGAADSDLTLVRRDLPPAGNAYTLWTNALPQLKLPGRWAPYDAFMLASNLSTNMPAGEARGQLDTWLESRKDAFALLRQGIALGQLQLPAFGVDDYFTKFDLSGLRHAARAKVILAREQAERAEYAEAAREFGEVFEMGRLIAAGDGPMIHYLFGIAVQSMGLNGVRWLAAQPDVPSAVLSQMLRDIPAQDESDGVLAQVYRVEFAQYAIPQLKKIEQDALSPTNNFPIRITRVLDVTNTIAIAEAFYARLVKNALGSWPNRDKGIEADAKHLVTLPDVDDPADFAMTLMMCSFQKQDREATKQWKQLDKLGRKQPNIFGRLLVSLMLHSCEKVHERSVKVRTEINMTRSLVGLQRFRRDNGSWPDSLAEVRSSAVLSDEPGDLFDGKPVRYSRAKGILWSVGPDEKDDGGDAEKDFVIKLPNQVPEDTARKLADPQH